MSSNGHHDGDDFTFADIFGPRRGELPARDGHTGELPAITGPIPRTPPPSDAEREAAAAAHGYLAELADATAPSPIAEVHHDEDDDPWDAYPVTPTWADTAAHYLATHQHLDDAELRRRTRIIIDGGPEALDWYLNELEPDVIAARLRWPMVEVLPSDEGTTYAALSKGRRQVDDGGQPYWSVAEEHKPGKRRRDDRVIEPTQVIAPDPAKPAARRRRPSQARKITRPDTP
jgi:hypothetical protein